MVQYTTMTTRSNQVETERSKGYALADDGPERSEDNMITKLYALWSIDENSGQVYHDDCELFVTKFRDKELIELLKAYDFGFENGLKYAECIVHNAFSDLLSKAETA